MKINYWDCKFSNHDEHFDEEGGHSLYLCDSKDNCDGICKLDNKWCGEEEYCPIAVIEIL